MIVWGGYDGTPTGLDTGGRYNPVTDSWTSTSTTNAPAPRAFGTAVWTGSEMVVWGGTGGSYYNTGGRYNPVTDSWTSTSTVNAPPGRASHTAVWTGSEMIVWGGLNGSANFNTGGRYNPATDSWQTISTVGAPSIRSFHSAIWTGSEMIVWGGSGTFFGTGELNTGGRYNPATNSWQSTSTVNAPAARQLHTAIWTGTKMVVWGGADNNNSSYLNTGGRYSASANTWQSTSTANAPAARRIHTAIWTGSEMVVWGGYGAAGFLNSGGRYAGIPAAPTLGYLGSALMAAGLLLLGRRALGRRRRG